MANINNIVKNDYFEWLYEQVRKPLHHNISYNKLFTLLHNTEFRYVMRNDKNRAQDGVDLRYRYSVIINDNESLLDILDDRPCSVLEMMVALAIRCEKTIMDNTEYGNRTMQWFWDMLYNLGLGLMTDDRFDEEYVSEKINILLDRQYEPNGKGGLFYIRNCQYDLRNFEIWTQMCWYIQNYV